MSAKGSKRIQGIICSACNELLVSLWGHDFHYCKCGSTAVDGGRNYVRYVWKTNTTTPKTVDVILYANNTFKLAPKKRAKKKAA